MNVAALVIAELAFLASAAPIVVRIFEQYVAGAGLGAIAEDLNRDGVPSPSGHDPARNRHRASARGAWGKSAVRAILNNPRYTGREVWNKARRDEELFDVEDVAAGYRSKMKPNDRSEWVWSSEPTHEAIISPELFEAASAQRRSGEHRQAVVKPRRKRTYCLSSLVFCGVCGRRMSGSWNNGVPYYRCHYPTEYAGAKGIDHPRTVYLRESDVTPALDEWLLGVFDPKNLDGAVAAMAVAQEPDEGVLARTEAARRKVADCDTRLTNLRKQIEGGNPPDVVLTWIREAEAERLAAQRELVSSTPAVTPLSEAEIRALVASQRKVLRSLARATPEQRATIYGEVLGLRMQFNPEANELDVEVRPSCTQVCVGGGKQTISPPPVWATEVAA